MSVQTLPSQLATGFSSCRNQTKFSRTTSQRQAYSTRALQQFMRPGLVKPPLENKFLQWFTVRTYHFLCKTLFIYLIYYKRNNIGLHAFKILPRCKTQKTSVNVNTSPPSSQHKQIKHLRLVFLKALCRQIKTFCLPSFLGDSPLFIYVGCCISGLVWWIPWILLPRLPMYKTTMITYLSLGM